MTKDFILKHEQLIKEENNLKEKLQNEVTKIKEKLEKSLSESNNEIKIVEKINKGIKNMEGENNILKNIIYISKINTSKTEMRALIRKSLKSLKINYEQGKNDILFEEFDFCAIPEPIFEVKDENFPDISIFWKLKDINDNWLEIIKFKYKVEMRKENEDFKLIYEGNNNSYSINNLKYCTGYEFRICSIYNDIICLWTEIKKIKNFNSSILKESKRENEFFQKIYEWTGFQKMELIYKGSRDGMTSKSFHDKCNNKGATITLIMNEKENIFGGYSSISWTCDGLYHKDPDCFIFSLSNVYNTEPTKFPFDNKFDFNVAHSKSSGPRFGYSSEAIYLPSDFKNDYCKSGFPDVFQDVLGKGKSIFTGDKNNNNNTFKIKEVEVFTLSNK